MIIFLPLFLEVTVTNTKHLSRTFLYLNNKSIIAAGGGTTFLWLSLLPWLLLLEYIFYRSLLRFFWPFDVGRHKNAQRKGYNPRLIRADNEGPACPSFPFFLGADLSLLCM